MGNKDTNNPLWGVIGFFLPIVGVILYLVWRYERVKDGNYAFIGAIIGGIIQLVLSILLRVFLFDLLIQWFNYL